MTDLDAIKARCLYAWDNVNDPPCHPSDADWRPCPVCVEPNEDNTPNAKSRRPFSETTAKIGD